MQGENQHHIPQMLQRGFSIRGRKNETWYFEKGAVPESKDIAEIGAGSYFYAGPTAEGEPNLDASMTSFESGPFSKVLNRLKGLSVGAAPSSEDAVAVIAHLTGRAAFVRDVFSRGIAQLAKGALEIFSDPSVLRQHVGLDADEPNEKFREKVLKSFLERDEVKASDIPTSVVERIAFAAARENFARIAADAGPAVAAYAERMIAGAPDAIREGHNRGLESDFQGLERQRQLQPLAWTIEAAPSEGLLLPDCVAVGVEEGGDPLPYLTAAPQRLASVAMPLNSKLLLVGRAPGSPAVDWSDFNRHAAACSDAFFIASTDDASLVELHELIGARSFSAIEQGLQEAFSDFRGPPPPEARPQAAPVPDDEGEGMIPPELQEFSYTFWGPGWSDEAATAKLIDEVKGIVAGIARIMPLQRLEGIAFSYDYAGVLAAVDRGVPGVAPPSTVAPEIGVGIAMTPLVRRDGVVKARVVMTGWLAEALIGDDEAAQRFALHAFVRQLAIVAHVQIFDTRLPGVLLTPLTDPLTRRLYPQVSAAIDGYFVARTAASFAPDDTLSTHQQLSVEALRRATDLITRQRLIYRFTGKLDELLAVALPCIQRVLEAIGDLLGLADGMERDPLVDAPELAAALQAAGLRDWLTFFRDDLRQMYERLGEWESFDEFLAFSRHVERVAWQFGLVPWRTDEGGVYVKVPEGTDAVVLEAAARAVGLLG